MKLIDLDAKDSAIKAGWISIFQKDPKCGQFAQMCIQPDLDDLIWACNLNVSDVDRICECKNIFWTDVLKAWCRYNYSDCQGGEEQPIIWWNSLIRIEDKPVFWKKAFDKGLILAEQLFEDGNQIGHEKAKEMFNLNFLEYGALMKAIPSIWKDALRRGEVEYRLLDPETDRYYEKVRRFRAMKSPTKVVYEAYLGSKSTDCVDQKALKWEKILGAPVEKQDICQSIHMAKSATCVMKYRSFQYRLALKAVTTNIQLKHWKIKDDDSCTFCGVERESIDHVLVMCPRVQGMWKEAGDFIQKMVGMDELSNKGVKEKILGIRTLKML